tara:strand:- start:4058 stop:4693 length:636 start_codon:yes stop_codon:yes gene_type:complete
MNCAITSASLARSLLLALAAAALAARDFKSLPEFITDRGLHGIPRPGVEEVFAFASAARARLFPSSSFVGVTGTITSSSRSPFAFTPSRTSTSIVLSDAFARERIESPSRLTDDSTRWFSIESKDRSNPRPPSRLRASFSRAFVARKTRAFVAFSRRAREDDDATRTRRDVPETSSRPIRSSPHGGLRIPRARPVRLRDARKTRTNVSRDA